MGAVAVIWLILLPASAFYFLLWRPQQRRMMAARALQSALDENDEVMTTSGMYGRITRLGDDDVDIEIAPGTVIRIARAARSRSASSPMMSSATTRRPADMRRQVILLTVTVVVIVGTFIATLASGNTPTLGLDLQGGVSVTLQPLPHQDLSTLDTAAQIIRNRVDGLGVAEPDVSRQGNTIVVDLPGAKNQQQAIDLVGQTAELRFRPVLAQIAWSAATAPSTTTTTGKAGATTTTVKGGVGASTTVPAGSSTTISGATSTTKKSLGARGIHAVPIAYHRPAAGTDTTVAATASTTSEHCEANDRHHGQGRDAHDRPAAKGDGTCQAGKIVTPREQNTAAAPQVILPDRDQKSCYVLGALLMTGKNIDTATAVIDPNQAEWIVNVSFKNDDFVKKVAEPYVNKQVAIVLDQVVQSAPTINQGITGKNVTISGSFTAKSARALALALRYGSLPVLFKQATSETVSPTLGKDQLHAGIVAGLIGLVLVALYMILFYRLLGLVVWVGIGLTGMTFYSLVTWLGVHQNLTLTLAGVTGIIVSVGVTVDSYVVYFERLKDEVRTGKTVRSSLDSGFRRAFRTIIAADLVSLLGAVVLYVLAAGSVRGFAYFLGLSTLLDLILAYCFMHPCVSLLARRPSLVAMPGVGIAAGLDVPGVRA